MAVESATCATWIRGVLIDQFEVPAESVTPGARLREDLGLDSLDLVDLLIEFERRVGQRIENEDVSLVRSVDDAAHLLERLEAKRGA
jgi:acyl carrier protein